MRNRLNIVASPEGHDRAFALGALIEQPRYIMFMIFQLSSVWSKVVAYVLNKQSSRINKISQIKRSLISKVQGYNICLRLKTFQGINNHQLSHVLYSQ